MFSIITGRRSSAHLRVWGWFFLLTLAGVSACDKLPLLAPNLSTISLSTSSSVVQANGAANVQATVLEGSGTPVQNGTTVTFSTNLGTMSPASARTVNGVATSQFVPNGQSGVAEIRATSGNATASTSSPQPLKITVGSAAAGHVQVTANPNKVSSTGGTSTITATVTDTNGNPLSGVVVSFSTTAGTLSNSSATSNSSGQATTTLTTSVQAVVTATTGTTAGTGTVTVTVGTTSTLAFGTPSPAAPTAGQLVSIPLTITAVTGADPFQSVVVNFGDGSSKDLGAQNSSTSVAHTYTSDGVFTLTATGTTTAGDRSQTTTQIAISPTTPISVNLSSTQSTSGGNTLVNFTATVSPSSTPVSSYSWSFGDPANTTRTTTGNQTSFSYVTGSGPKSVSVTVTANNGQQGSSSTTVVP